MTHIRRITLYAFLAIVTMAFSVAIAQNAERGTHIVKSGETLYRISKMYDITVEKLYELNPEARNGINPGQVLQLPTYQDDKEATYHMVEAGQTLYSISKKYGVTVGEILKVNSQIKSETEIAAGMIIKIPPRTDRDIRVPSNETTPPPSVRPESDGMTGLKLYTVPAGATVYSLLKETGWSEAQLLHYNPQIKEGLKAGMSILIPDMNMQNNLAIGDQTPLLDLQTVVLTLPFATDNSQRFKKYYEGFLMALLDLKKSGASFSVHVVDCSDDRLRSTMQELKALPRIELIIGGVSDQSVRELSQLALDKSATYVIPFTSRNYTNAETGSAEIYQVNTPHQSLYAEAAQKFAREYRGYHIHIVNFPNDEKGKDPFIDVLTQELSRQRMTYTEAPQQAFATPEDVLKVSNAYGKVVVVPNSGSMTAANNILYPISTAADSLGVTNVVAFGYPEWQTYVRGLGTMMNGAEASFYTTFHVDPDSSEYKAFESDFRKWYGHGLGSTFPRYGLLGYDTGKYFLTQLYRNGYTASVSRGIQSEFKFEKNKGNPHLHSNLGVFFVKYNSLGGTRRY